MQLPIGLVLFLVVTKIWVFYGSHVASMSFAYNVNVVNKKQLTSHCDRV